MDTLVIALRVALSLGVVLALLWVLQRRVAKGGFGVRARGRQQPAVSLVGRQGLGGKASVVVVDVAGERLVLGVTESQVRVLSTAAGEVVQEAVASSDSAVQEIVVQESPAVEAAVEAPAAPVSGASAAPLDSIDAARALMAEPTAPPSIREPRPTRPSPISVWSPVSARSSIGLGERGAAAPGPVPADAAAPSAAAAEVLSAGSAIDPAVDADRSDRALLDELLADDSALAGGAFRVPPPTPAVRHVAAGARIRLDAASASLHSVRPGLPVGAVQVVQAQMVRARAERSESADTRAISIVAEVLAQVESAPVEAPTVPAPAPARRPVLVPVPALVDERPGPVPAPGPAPVRRSGSVRRPTALRLVVPVTGPVTAAQPIPAALVTAPAVTAPASPAPVPAALATAPAASPGVELPQAVIAPPAPVKARDVAPVATGALAGSILSPGTWRQAAAALRSRRTG